MYSPAHQMRRDWCRVCTGREVDPVVLEVPQQTLAKKISAPASIASQLSRDA